MKKVIYSTLLFLFLVAISICWMFINNKQTAPGEYENELILSGGELT